MPPPPIPARKEEGHTGPPPIPPPKGEGHPAEPPPIPVRKEEEEGQREPEPSAAKSPPKWRPAGAVATVMASSQQGWQSSAGRPEKGEDVEQQEEEHSTNPYDLKAASGSIVTASYPFQGEVDLQQLSFTVGDTIKVKQKEEMWSWGILERSGAEGWFPHNYVGSTFKPLPGIHEMAQKIKERRERLEGAAAAASGTTSDAPGSTLPGGADAPDSSLAGAADGAPTVGADGEGGASGGEPKDGGDANDARNSKDVGEPEKGVGGADGADGASVSGHAKAESSGGAAEGGDLNKSTSSELARKKSTDVDGENKPPLASAVPSARSASAAPSLPPFLKGGGDAPEVVTAPAVMVTQRAPEAVKDSEVVGATPIEGVGYAGAPIQPTPRCKCCIM